jgi:hypothetical protein
MEAMYRVECCAFDGQWRVLGTVDLNTALTMAAFMRLGAQAYDDVRIVNDATGEEWVPG